MLNIFMALFFIVCIYNNSFGMQDNCHFYRASNIFYEPRFDRDWLNTIEVSVGGGDADTGRSKKGAIQPLSGVFRIVEANFLIIQNMTQGLFFQAHMPVRSLSMQQWSRVQDACSYASNFIYVPSFDTTAQGDMTVHVGYVYSYQQDTKLDFIDVALRGGLLVPTGTRFHVHNGSLIVPTGYNGHWAFPLACDFSVGAYEWLTVAAHVSCLIFANEVLYTSGKPLFHGGLLLKADHIMRGISCSLAYSYALQGQSKTDVHSPSSCINIFSQGFNMHVLHFAVEFDWLRQDYWYGIRCAFFYDYTIAGASIFNTNMMHGNVGLEVLWDF